MNAPAPKITPRTLLKPRDWQQIAQRQAADMLGTPEAAEKLAEARRYGALADELEHLQSCMRQMAGLFGVPSASPAELVALVQRAIADRDDALAAESVAQLAAEAEWIPVGERLPDLFEPADWIFPLSDLKHERWMLCNATMVAASVPGRATHWRPAAQLPPAEIPPPVDIEQMQAEQARLVSILERVAVPAAPAPDRIRQLIAAHADLLDQHPHCYFELAWTRSTGWMAWLTDKPARGEPGTAEFAQSRTVLARGQGDSADEACRDALAALATRTD